MKDSRSTAPVSDLLAALSDPLRLRLLRLLEREELSVGEVASVVQLPQSTISRHLKTLTDSRPGRGRSGDGDSPRGAGLLTRRTEGTATLYRLILDDLPQSTRSLWVTIREQLEAADSPSRVELEEDLRRLAGVLSERRDDAQAFFGRVAGQWDDLRNDLFGDRFTPVALLGLLDPAWTVADLGCGTGNAAELLAPHVRQVIAIDQSAPMLKAAKQRLASFTASNIRLVKGDLDAIPIDSGSVDAAVCILVLHHLEDPTVAIREMGRILKPSGKLLLVDMLEHNRASFRHRLGHRWSGFSERTIRDWLTAAGFTATRFRPLPPQADARGPGLFVCIGSAT